MLCAGRHLNNGFPFEGRDFHFSTEDGRDEVDRHITGDVEAFAMEDLMGSDGHGHIKVAGRAAIGTMLSFIGETKSHAGLNTGRNMDGDPDWTFVRELASGLLHLSVRLQPALEAAEVAHVTVPHILQRLADEG